MLQAFDGFDHYNSSVDVFARADAVQWEAPGVVTIVPGRVGGYAISLSAPFYTISGVFSNRMASAGIGFGAYSFGGTAQDLSLQFIDTVANSVQATVVFRAADQSIQVYRGTNIGTLLYSTGPAVWDLGVWFYAEAWIKVDGVYGTAEVRVNGQPYVDVTGLNTQTTGNAWWDKVTVTGYSYMDDFYYADSLVGPGSYPCSSPLGDVRVASLFTIGTDAVQWAPLANQNWQELNEPAMDSDGSYNYTLTAGAEDRLNFAPLRWVDSKIIAVQVTGAYRKSDATMHTLEQVLKSNTIEVPGELHYLPDTSYAYYSDLFSLDPNTGASWTLNGVNGLAAGYRLVS